LGVVLVGDDPASQVYVRNKFKACEAVGMKSFETKLSADVSPAELKKAIDELNGNPEVHGFLVQLPLPDGFNTDEVLSWVDPKKDADGLTIENIGLFHAGQPRSVPCTPHGVIKMLKAYDFQIEGANAVVIGRSQIVGWPMARLLMDENATVTVCHSRTADLKAHTKAADIVVVAAGRPEFVDASHFKKDAVVIDVGIHRTEHRGLVGDVKASGCAGHLKALSPVPGGVGPMTITMLLANTLRLAKGHWVTPRP
jgi:methylenetetrahydrofolate dehydrogenase (NADP+)/methenyltetrahydrofolate cyclohydrolase